MINPWILWIIGLLFCGAGVYLFFKNIYEDNRSVRWPVIIMIKGAILITAGTAEFLNLIH